MFTTSVRLPVRLAASVTTPIDDEGLDRDEGKDGHSWMPSPPAMAVAVLCMLAFGVMLGSAISPLARSAGVRSILLEVEPRPPVEQEEPVVALAPKPPAAAEPGPPLPASTSSLPPVAPPPVEKPVPEAPAEPILPPEIPEEEALPPVTHVFLIVLGENGFEESFGESSTAPYLAKTLPEKGELIANYYATSSGDLANQIALISGQGPTPETVANCPTYADIVPGTISAAGQVEGAGCVYPAATPSLPRQLAEQELTWKAYVEDRIAPCAHEEGSRDPFVYFHSFTDTPECAATDVGLDQLAPDLATATKTPALSYIVPNACHAGAELPCEEGQPAGPAAAEAFLQSVVPAIEASPAYREGGLIAITSAQARQTGAAPDTSSCCIAPLYPNLPVEAAPEAATGPVKPTGGGGRVGLLLLSPFVVPGTVDESGYYNHYSLLFSIEELFGLERVGYAAEEALTAFDGSVYGGYPAGSSSSASCRDCASSVASPSRRRTARTPGWRGPVAPSHPARPARARRGA